MEIISSEFKKSFSNRECCAIFDCTIEREANTLPNSYRSYFNQLDNFKLLLSASAQFNHLQLRNLIQNIIKLPIKNKIQKILILDLRQETHCFIDGTPISLRSHANAINKGEKRDNIIVNENKWIKRLESFIEKGIEIIEILTKNDEGDIKEGNIIKVVASKAESENDLVNSLNSHFTINYGVKLIYRRLPVLDHHAPEQGVIDSFIIMIKEILNTNNTWLHVHCKGGKGRSTTFSMIYELIVRKKLDSLEQFIERRAILGDINILERNITSNVTWLREAAIKRRQFIINFYNYIKDNRNGFYSDTSWSLWEERKIGLY
jgi:protein-tyrosine phosphatase